MKKNHDWLLKVMEKIEVEAEETMARAPQHDDMRHAVGRVYGMRFTVIMTLPELCGPPFNPDYKHLHQAYVALRDRTDERIKFHYKRLEKSDATTS